MVAVPLIPLVQGNGKLPKFSEVALSKLQPDITVAPTLIVVLSDPARPIPHRESEAIASHDFRIFIRILFCRRSQEIPQRQPRQMKRIEVYSLKPTKRGLKCEDAA